MQRNACVCDPFIISCARGSVPGLVRSLEPDASHAEQRDSIVRPLHGSARGPPPGDHYSRSKRSTFRQVDRCIYVTAHHGVKVKDAAISPRSS